MESNEEKRTKRKVRKATPGNEEKKEEPALDIAAIISEKPKKEEIEIKPRSEKQAKKEETAKEEFARPDSLLIMEIKNDGRAYLRDAKYTGKGYCLYDEITKRTYMITSTKDKHPPIFYFPHKIANGRLSGFFFNLAKTFGLKTVMYPTLLFLANNLKPVEVYDKDEPYILEWKEAKADRVSGIEWSQSLGTAKMADILAQRQNAGLSNMFMYLLLGIIVIGIVAIIYMLMSG